ncbi:MAG: TIGR03118 family protein [Caulobacteraceae bacterium]
MPCAHSRSIPWRAAVGGALLAALATAGAAHAERFRVTNLVSDGFVPAATIDPNLINPWGISYAPTGPFWVSDNNSGVSTLYDGAGGKVPLTVNIPPPNGAGGAGTPTGQVFNGVAGDFRVSAGGASGATSFIFATEDGTISAWAPSLNFTNAILAVDNSNGGAGAVYKGLAIGSSGGGQFLYAANFRAGDVEVYDNHFNQVKTFTDPGVAAGYAPFNTQILGGELFVTFALQNAAKHDDVSGPGHGYVDVFNLDGTFNRRLVSMGGAINSPWGLDIAPASFGSLAGDLLVGNFGDGTIGAFDPLTGAFKGDLLDAKGAPIVLGDLWGLITGNGARAGRTDTLYFTAGVQDEAHGLFGSLAPVPEPATWAMMLVGLAGMGAVLRRGRDRLPALEAVGPQSIA